jgi:ubiquinone biosynthesis O-methyltransferase
LVLDIGCGGGRLAIMCGKEGAKKVIGFDYTEEAIRIANLILRCSGLRNVIFRVADLSEGLQCEERFDIVIMSEVIEHLETPLEILLKIKKVLREGGWLVVSCPNFSNFRGYVYNTLFSLLKLPMSLTDVRQVNSKQMRNWCEQSGYKIERIIGTLYELGWTQEAHADLERRIPLAVRDSDTLDEGVCNYGELGRFLKERVEENEKFLSCAVSSKILQKIPRDKMVLKRYDFIPDELWKKIISYMGDEEGVKNTFYTDEFPFNLLGAGCIYLLRRE